MYNRTNKTALNSQKRIKTSFLHILKNTSYENILIKDICKKADISRQRFYYLFESKDEIVLSILKDFFNNAIEHIKNKQINSLFNIIELYYTTLDNDENIKRLIAIDNINYMFTNMLAQYINNLHTFKIGTVMNLNDLYAHYFLSAGLNNMFIKWINNNKDVPLTDIIKLTYDILLGNHFKD